ncbi:hypothetical protein [Ureaplasma ceti]|uniref:Lipoprotein n=1 Tax=Ureaplasma ceti TaxID=3119530 RepID=A0ABP9UDA9_9BACT
MKINKKALGIGLGIFATVALIPTLAVTLTSCGSPATSTTNAKAPKNFFNALNDPYKELNMFAATLDAAHEQYSQPAAAKPVSNGLATRAAAESETAPAASASSETFTQRAKKINDSLRNFVTKLAESKSIKDLTDKNSTVLFVKNDRVSWNANGSNDNSRYNDFQIEQPILYSQIYSTPSVKECPGFGFKFPTPRNDEANKLFDDWFEIGASDQAQGWKDSTVAKLTDAFQGTADFVFYLYDSKNFKSEADVQAFTKMIYDQKVGSSSEFNAGKLVNPNSPVKHVIPLDIEWMYNGNWDVMGQWTMDYLFAQIFANINTEGGINQFYNSSAFDVKNGSINTVTPALTDKASAASQDILNIANEQTWSPMKATEALKTIRPVKPTKEEQAVIDRNKGKNEKFMTTMFNTTGLSLALGIAPDKIVSYDANASMEQYHNLSLYLAGYTSKITTANGTQSKDTFVENATTSQFLSLLDSNNVYALADNRDSFGKGNTTGEDLAPWPLKQTATETQAQGIQLQHEDVGTTSAVKGHCIPVYTERNDTAFTQYSEADNKDFNLQLWNTVTQQATTYTSWINSFKK